jgi:hypothetical protein
MITQIRGKCRQAGCTLPGTRIARGRARDPAYSPDPGHPAVACYCELHAWEVAREGDPEYRAECPNCGCVFGVP